MGRDWPDKSPTRTYGFRGLETGIEEIIGAGD